MNRARAARIVDELGALKAKISELSKQEEALKEQLKAAGDNEYDGALFRATVSSYVQEKLDMDAVRAKLSPQFIAAHTRQVPCTKVSVVARVRAKAA